MNRLKPIIAILVVFMLGMVAGALGGWYYAMSAKDHPPHRRSIEKRVEFILKRLSDDLNLSADQQKEIRPIVVATEKKIQSVREQYQPEIRVLLDAGVEEIKRRLNPDQRAELSRIHAEWKQRRQQRK